MTVVASSAIGVAFVAFSAKAGSQAGERAIATSEASSGAGSSAGEGQGEGAGATPAADGRDGPPSRVHWPSADASPDAKERASGRWSESTASAAPTAASKARPRSGAADETSGEAVPDAATSSASEPTGRGDRPASPAKATTPRA